MVSSKNRWSLLVSWFALLLFLSITIAGGKWKRHTVIKSDAAGYYVYLPSLFIYHDILKCNFYPYIDSVYNPADGMVYYAVQQNHETGNMYFKYTYGVAVFEAPLFFIAHSITLLTHQYPADGYSAFYQLSVAISTVLFSLLGLLVLRKFLLSFFEDYVVAITLFILSIGTNFFTQTITQPGNSHIYLFFLYAVILYSTNRWYEYFSWRYSLLLAFSLGLCIVTRATDVVIIFFPLLWCFITLRMASVWRAQKQKIFFMLVLIAVLVFVQLVYWKLSTGDWFFYTYKNEHFNFGNWQIVNGLFSYRKGWFVYTPLALLGFLGALLLRKNQKLKFYLLPFLIYFLVTLYVVFCWWQWYYGGSFGCRVMIESLALLALPMAALVEFILQQNQLVRNFSFAAIALLISLNLFQTAQYARGI
ncbi:MAG: hypothetical protein NTY88_07900, partial [Bacteroidetes bacterium]|nr:hypothetical protein [Bacteroidota bacterium]